MVRSGPGSESMLTGFVLAGGASSRMGRDKALIEVRGEALAARTHRILCEAGCESVYLVGGEVLVRRSLFHENTATGLGGAYFETSEGGAGLCRSASRSGQFPRIATYGAGLRVALNGPPTP